jgi:hypothetical protein
MRGVWLAGGAGATRRRAEASEEPRSDGHVLRRPICKGCGRFCCNVCCGGGSKSCRCRALALPVHSAARRRLTAYRPWSARVDFLARLGCKIVARPAAPASPFTSVRAERADPGGARAGTAEQTDRCRRKRPPGMTRPASGRQRRLAGRDTDLGVAGSIGTAISPERAANRRVTSRSIQCASLRAPPL